MALNGWRRPIRRKRRSGPHSLAPIIAEIRRPALRADQDIVREGDRPTRSCLVLDGFVCIYKVTGEGKRQILTGEGKRQIQAFHIPGDIPDIQSLHLRVLDISLR